MTQDEWRDYFAALTQSKRHVRHTESRTQQACVRYFRLRYPALALLLISIPNGGQRNAREAAIMKREGTTRGAPDLFLFVPNTRYHGLAIEMKTQTGRLSPFQQQWRDTVTRQGYMYTVCRSTDEFISTVTDYLATAGTQQRTAESP